MQDYNYEDFDTHRADVITDLHRILTAWRETTDIENSIYLIELETVFDSFINPVKVPDEQLPAIFYRYGGERPSSIVYSTDFLTRLMVIELYSVINDRAPTDETPADPLMQRCARFHRTLEKIVLQNKQLGGNVTQDVTLGTIEPYIPSMLSERQFLKFEIIVTHLVPERF